MAEISYINPLSNEGREIIKDYGDLNQLEREDEYLIEDYGCGMCRIADDIRVSPEFGKGVDESRLSDAHGEIWRSPGRAACPLYFCGGHLQLYVAVREYGKGKFPCFR